MERLIMPYAKLVLIGAFLGVGLIIGANIGMAMLKMGAPHLSKPQGKQ